MFTLLFSSLEAALQEEDPSHDNGSSSNEDKSLGGDVGEQKQAEVYAPAKDHSAECEPQNNNNEDEEGEFDLLDDVHQDFDVATTQQEERVDGDLNQRCAMVDFSQVIAPELLLFNRTVGEEQTQPSSEEAQQEISPLSPLDCPAIATTVEENILALHDGRDNEAPYNVHSSHDASLVAMSDESGIFDAFGYESDHLLNNARDTITNPGSSLFQVDEQELLEQQDRLLQHLSQLTQLSFMRDISSNFEQDLLRKQDRDNLKQVAEYYRNSGDCYTSANVAAKHYARNQKRRRDYSSSDDSGEEEPNKCAKQYHVEFGSPSVTTVDGSDQCGGDLLPSTEKSHLLMTTMFMFI